MLVVMSVFVVSKIFLYLVPTVSRVSTYLLVFIVVYELLYRRAIIL